MFLNWMLHNFGGFFYGMYPCWNWNINGVLVTYWLRSGIVKIYHDGGQPEPNGLELGAEVRRLGLAGA